GELRVKREEAQRAVAEARRFIDEATEDRPAAAERIARAERELELAEAALAKRQLDWGSLGSLFAEAAAIATKARVLAESDVRLAQQAGGEIADAQAAIQSADRYFGHGISADMSMARSHLERAMQALGRRAYEE